MRARLPEATPQHVGLAYTRWAPLADNGKVRETARWLARLAETQISADYGHAFARWQRSFRAPGDRLWEMRLVSRLLVGHGNGSATDVGLTVHHTWGVPMVPGSALKGLVAHYLDTVYGPDELQAMPWEQPDGEQAQRALWQGTLWNHGRIRRGPGAFYRTLLGAPDAETDDDLRTHDLPAGAIAGQVQFHDGLYVPGSAASDHPFAVDVLTVHHKPYYDRRGTNWPNDHADPNPVAFLSVKPRIRLLFALSGPIEWTRLAERLLTEALQEWGVGGKTSSGYGRFTRVEQQEPRATAQGRSSRPRHRPGDRVRVERVEDPGGRGRVRFLADDGMLAQFVNENPPAVAVGEGVEVWIANVAPQSYTLTLRPPKDPRVQKPYRR